MCNGRLIFGPDARSLIVTLLLVIVPVAIFCTFVASNLFHKFPSYNAGYAILVATIVYTIYVSSPNLPLIALVFFFSFSFYGPCFIDLVEI